MSDSSWSVPINPYIHSPSILSFSSPSFLCSRSYLSMVLSRVTLSSRLSSSLPLSLKFSLYHSLTAADTGAGERAGRYVHFYALIYAHANTKNNPVSKPKDNKCPAGDVADNILPLRWISFHILIYFTLFTLPI